MNGTNTVIAIDGYSSTGKSTFARMLAAKYGLIYVDTGALYRGVTYLAIKRKLIDDNNKIDSAGLDRALESLNLAFKGVLSGGTGELFMDSVNIENEIRRLEVSSKVSLIASLGSVRLFVNNLLEGYGKKGGVVMDGRDIGTVVLPNADIKIFMTASAEVRAKRRYDEMLKRGEDADFEAILANVKERDFIDTNREIAPLKKADDAVVLDNSNMSLVEQMAWFEKTFTENETYN